jgi:hypothetical protein
MGTYVTTNVRLPAEMLKALKRRALDEGTSVADLVRASVASYLVRDDGQAVDYENDPFFALGREPGVGPSDGSENHDRYIYALAVAKPA